MGVSTNMAMTRRPRGQSAVVAISVCLLLAFGSCCAHTVELANGVSSKRGPSTLVLYEHEDRVHPGNTVVTTASPSRNYTIEFGTMEFGTINVIANVLREGIAIDSKVLGRALGQVTFEDDLSISLGFTFQLNTAAYAGTLTCQGILDKNGAGELVITGGTADFRWARGYVEVHTLSTAPADAVFKNTLHIKYY